MKTYHKINTLFKRDEKTHNIILGDYSLPEFEYLKNNLWMWTEKIDGTNIRIIYETFPYSQISFKGKSDDAQIPLKLMEYLNNTFKLDDFKKIFGEEPKRVCLYGEGFGAGIQKGGGNYSPTPKFILFDVWIDSWWLSRENIEDIANKLNIEIVPIVLEKSSIETAITLCKSGFNSIYGDFKAEGLVGIPLVPLFDRKGKRIIVKLKYKDFNFLKIIKLKHN